MVLFVSFVFCMAIAGVTNAYAASSVSAPESGDGYESAFPGISLAAIPSVHPLSSGSVITAQSIINGKGSGTYAWANGDTYKGKWKAYAMNGRGVYKYADGTTLTGTFSNNRFKAGTYKAKTSKGSFVLTVKNYLPYKAKIKTKSGFKYEGAFKNGKPNGKGTATYKSGGTYTGMFVNGKRSGKGTYTWKDGAEYTGTWKKDVMKGKGTYYYPDDSDAEKLTGQFANNAPKGTCKYTLWWDGTYKTYWKNGKCVKVM